MDREKKEQSETMHAVDKILVHSKYIAETYDNDIALIKLKEPIVFSEYVIAACLPEADFLCKNDMFCASKLTTSLSS